jgi:hypothetical protein
VKASEVEEYLSPREIAQRLRMSTRRVHDLLVPGQLWPVTRINARVIRVRASVVAKFLKDRTWNPKPMDEEMRGAA